MRKGNQEQICVKLDQSALSELEMEWGTSGMPKNRIINRALIAYCQALDIARGLRAGQYKENQVSGWFLKVLVPWILCSNDLCDSLEKMKEVKKWK